MALIFAICLNKTGSGIVWAQDSRNMVIKIKNDNRQGEKIGTFAIPCIEVLVLLFL